MGKLEENVTNRPRLQKLGDGKPLQPLLGQNVPRRLAKERSGSVKFQIEVEKQRRAIYPFSRPTRV